MTLTQLETFIAIIEQRSFTAAARKLGISQSGVSHALSGLESELGVTLIERDRQRPALTAIGSTLYRHAGEILRRHDLMHQEALAARGLQSGRLTIGSFGHSASIQLLPPLLAELKQKHPGISVTVLEGAGPEIIDWLEQRRVDVGFVALPNDSLDCVQVAADQLLALVPEHHPLASQPALSLTQLGGEAFILSAAGSGPLIERAFREVGVAPDVRYRIQQIGTILNFVQHGLGVSIIAALAMPDTTPGVKVLPLAPPIHRQIGLAMRRHDPSPAARALLAMAGYR